MSELLEMTGGIACRIEEAFSLIQKSQGSFHQQSGGLSLSIPHTHSQSCYFHSLVLISTLKSSACVLDSHPKMRKCHSHDLLLHLILKFFYILLFPTCNLDSIFTLHPSLSLAISLHDKQCLCFAFLFFHPRTFVLCLSRSSLKFFAVSS